MGWRIVRQPNGLLARFSEVVDDFTDYDMTEAEAVELCREWCGRQEAAEKVARGLADEPRWQTSPRLGDGLDRWREALHAVELVHGKRVRRRRERMLSKPTGDGAPSVIMDPGP